MTKAAIRKSIRKLPVEDKIELIDELWHLVASDQSEIPVLDWQKQMIDKHLAEIEADPNVGVSLEEFNGKMDRAIHRLEKRGRKKSR